MSHHYYNVKLDQMIGFNDVLEWCIGQIFKIFKILWHFVIGFYHVNMPMFQTL